ncbi:MAG: DNRLRE domain-containing protein [Desulfobacterales bacterium]|nr:DNRLRE domain-containing protein [Desulfobacterales bacterium]
MAKNIAGVLIFLTVCVGWVASLSAADRTRVFQQGLDGYAGVEDTWTNTNDWASPPQNNNNYGQSDTLMLERSGVGNPLLRFDLVDIPVNSTLVSATLSLYNTTQSGSSGQDFARRVRLYNVLVDWDEGNQSGSPIDAPGDHGATGYNAFDYYAAEGVDVPWGELGMAEGDYAAIRESYADVVNEGWYTWDATSLVRAWIRGDRSNFGVVLRDATGYEDDHADTREFISSQNANADSRPKLTVVYNADVPFADAGPDQENLEWSGGPVTLDGSDSSDRPGGDDNALIYSWRIARAAYGSTMSGSPPGATAVTSFTPDVAGEWEIELTVTNELGESATDAVQLRLLAIPSTHPRIYLTAAKLAALKTMAVPSNSRWMQLKGEADDPEGEMHAKALVCRITGQTSYCDQAIAIAQAKMVDNDDSSDKPGNIALVFDWCRDNLASEEVAAFIAYFNAWGDAPKDEDSSGWGNYWPRYGYSFAMIGLASYGDNPRAREWLDEYRHRRYRDYDLPLLDHIAGGGAWPEGMVYDWIANWPRIKAVEAWRTAAGENLFESTRWFRNRLGYFLLYHWPGQADNWGDLFHPYVSTGDSERDRGSMTNYGRIQGLILVERFIDDPLARQLQAYLATPPVNNSRNFLYHEEFLWFNPDHPSETPNRLSHFASGTGTIFMRSDWPSGAADTDVGATYLTFQSGDHFTYHQHFDQNSFTLFKHAPLALDSGVYSGDGLSEHDINYYVRTIAHNTLVVYNPAEDFSRSRPGASSNDGGQRSVYPGSRSPENVDYFQQYKTRYDTGDMVRFEDNTFYVYALGDATNAYNNPSYNQAMDTGQSGSTAKVSRFHREFVYLRPDAPGAADYLVLYDRVGVVDAAFSGQNTKLLFHTFNEPSVNGVPETISAGETLYSGADLATAVNGEGKLFIKVLAPASRNLRVVGGRGQKAFWVFGANYDWHWDAGEDQPRPTNNYEDEPYGEWRIELEPADAALEHNFLTVLVPTGSAAAMPDATLISDGGMEGVHIADSTLDRVVLFSSANDGGSPTGAITYTVPIGDRSLHLLVDLAPGTRYRISNTRAAGSKTVSLTPDSGGGFQVGEQGALSFFLGAGADPAPDVTINGSDGPITVSAGEPLSARVTLSPGARVGHTGDSWIGVLTSFPSPYDWLTLVDGAGWNVGVKPYEQGPIHTMPSTEILNFALPPGVYFFFFSVDDSMDGVPAAQWLDYEVVTVE